MMLLLTYGADVFVVNAEGNSAYDVASEVSGPVVKRLCS